MVKKEYCNYKTYGKCLSITNGDTKILVTVDIGPRIIYLANKDNDNLMFEDLADSVSQRGEFFDTNFKKGEAWHIYGGHRLWKSPEDWASYSPDNYPVDVEEIDGGAIFTTQPEYTTTGLQKSLKITMNESGEITIQHSFTNKGNQPTKVSLWALTVMNKGGRAYLPFNTADTGLLSNRNLVLWAYTDIKDSRFDLRNDSMVLRQDPSVQKAFKLGYFNNFGVAYYQYNKKLFRKQFDVVEGGCYPDSNSNMECYTNQHILEVETLGELCDVLVGATISHKEVWTLFNENAAEYKEIDAKF